MFNTMYCLHHFLFLVLKLLVITADPVCSAFKNMKFDENFNSRKLSLMKNGLKPITYTLSHEACVFNILPGQMFYGQLYCNFKIVDYYSLVYRGGTVEQLV